MITPEPGFPDQRPRRLRKSEAIRSLVRENQLCADQFVMPYFIKEGRGVREAIDSMPGQFRYSMDTLLEELEDLQSAGVSSILLFGIASDKNARASAAYDAEGVVQKACRQIKETFPDLFIITDVCLCAYMDHGHCGIVSKDGVVLNDESLDLIAKTALSHAQAGADMVAPSDMMDGRVRAIRRTLDQAGYSQTPIMSYAAKYASAFYGPFRDAADSAPQVSEHVPNDRKTYQMDPANAKEALREMELDLQEGADILMVKPALAYLDIVHAASQKWSVPIAAYAVSGEFSMIKAAVERGWADEKSLVLETLMSLRRAGAGILITYYAKQAARWIQPHNKSQVFSE